MSLAGDILKGIALAFSSFSKVPMPNVDWDERNMRYMMCFFPFVGLAIGVVLLLWTWLAQIIGFGSVVYGAGLTLVPLAITGGIHLDGFCDVVDAQSSHAEPARKREILKDPHIGAFAAMGVAAYLIAYTAFASELPIEMSTAALLCGAHVASRCMSGIATLVYPTSSSKGMLSMFHESGQGRVQVIVLAIILVATAALMILFGSSAGIAMIAIALLCLVVLYPYSQTQFGGMSGDVAGFFLQVAELAMVVAFVIITKVGL